MKLTRLVDRIRSQNIEPHLPVSSAVVYQSARARRESATADMARMEARERASKLFDAVAVRECIVDAQAIIRQAVSTLPAEIAAAVLPLNGDEHAIRVEMERHIDAALERIAAALELGAN